MRISIKSIYGIQLQTDGNMDLNYNVKGTGLLDVNTVTIVT